MTDVVPVADGSGDAGDDALLAAYIGRNADYYLREARVMARSGTRISWNWPAFLFNVLWLAYRKMWAPTALMFVLTVVFNLSIFFTWMTPVFGLLLGMVGNTLYLADARRGIGRIAETATGPEAALAEAEAKGGTSWLAVWVVFALLVGVSVIGFLMIGTALAALVAGLMWWDLGQWVTSPPQ